MALWLRKYGHEMPKRTLLYSNNPLISVFKTGKLFKHERGSHNGMYYRFRDKKNRKRVTGTAKLKTSQQLGQTTLITSALVILSPKPQNPKPLLSLTDILYETICYT